MYTINTRNIGAAEKGIRLTTIIDPKFNVSTIKVSFIQPLDPSTAAQDSFLGYILEDTNREYPTIADFNRRLAELYGADISVINRRMGDYRVLSFSANGISDRYVLEGEDLSYELMKLICGCIFDPVLENGVFPQKQTELKRNELVVDINAEINDKRSYALKQAGKIIYKGEPAGAPLKGEADEAAKISAEDMMEAYRRLLRSAKIEIYYAAAAISDKFIELTEKTFSGIERSDVCGFDQIPSPLKDEPTEATDTLDVVQSKMVLAFKYDEKFRKRSEVVKLFITIFGSAPFSLLFKNVREKMSLCYYCSAFTSPLKSVMCVDSGLESANAETAKKEILHQLEMMKNGEFTEEVLDQAKMYVNTALRAVTDFPGSLSNWFFERFYEDAPSPMEYSKRIDTVTKDEITEFARSLALDTVYLLKGV